MAAGEAAGCLLPRISPKTEALLFLATLQGVQLMVRTAEDREAMFDSIAKPLLSSLDIKV